MPSSPLRYHLMDVFTAIPLSGNPLAVFSETQGLEPATMQAIARELNLSETVFIGEREGSQRFPIRIFTPSRELPFAGHPTAGAAHLLAELALVDRSQPLILEALTGPLTVRFEGKLACFEAAMSAECRASSLGRRAAAELFGLESAAIAEDPLLASCGLPYHLVPLTSRAALSSARPDASQWRHHVSPSGVEQVYLYVEEGSEIAARMFTAGGNGALYEDPATGSAAAALAGYLGSREAPQASEWRIHQGVDMGRPSEILTHVRCDDGTRVRVEIGGRAVIVGEGMLYPRR